MNQYKKFFFSFLFRFYSLFSGGAEKMVKLRRDMGILAAKIAVSRIRNILWLDVIWDI